MSVFYTRVLFLGHVLPAKSISVNIENVEKVKNLPVPQNFKEVQSILDLASYYRWIINQFAKKAQCLHELVGPTFKQEKEQG